MTIHAFISRGPLKKERKKEKKTGARLCESSAVLASTLAQPHLHTPFCGFTLPLPIMPLACLKAEEGKEQRKVLECQERQEGETQKMREGGEEVRAGEIRLQRNQT